MSDRTLASYEAAAQRYREQAHHAPNPAWEAWLARAVAAAPPGGAVLELGSGPGFGALALEAHGLVVRRTDATPAFIEMLRSDGHPAELLDARSADYGGPFDMIFADAVLLHLTRPEFATALRTARAAVRDGGMLAMTLKEGDGDEWHTRKLDLPRYFTYWREPELRAELLRAGWAALSIEHVQGRLEPWLYTVSRAG